MFLCAIIVNSASQASTSQVENVIVPINNESDDEDVVFVQITENPIVAVVDLCSPDFDTRPKRPRGTNAVESHTSTAASSSLTSRHNANPVMIPQPTPPPPIPSPSSSLSQSNCAICMDLPFNNNPTSTLCGHVFCKKCIEQAIQLYQKCPICNRKLKKNQIHPIYFF